MHPDLAELAAQDLLQNGQLVRRKQTYIQIEDVKDVARESGRPIILQRVELRLTTAAWRGDRAVDVFGIVGFLHPLFPGLYVYLGVASWTGDTFKIHTRMDELNVVRDFDLDHGLHFISSSDHPYLNRLLLPQKCA
jgi:hypothetical protein